MGEGAALFLNFSSVTGPSATRQDRVAPLNRKARPLATAHSPALSVKREQRSRTDTRRRSSRASPCRQGQGQSARAAVQAPKPRPGIPRRDLEMRHAENRLGDPGVVACREEDSEFSSVV